MSIHTQPQKWRPVQQALAIWRQAVQVSTAVILTRNTKKAFQPMAIWCSITICRRYKRIQDKFYGKYSAKFISLSHAFIDTFIISFNRYSRDTMPLLIAPLQEPIPQCQNCGGDVLCEVQVLSTLISKLRFPNNEPVPIEYGNVLIYTCTKSCWDTPDKMRLEHIIVQQEA